MNIWQQAYTWLNDPLNWTNPDGIIARTVEHLWISAAAVGLAIVVAWPVGIWLGHPGRGGATVVTVANLTRAIPTVALLTIFPLTAIGFGYQPIILALAVFAMPPLLANAYLGRTGGGSRRHATPRGAWACPARQTVFRVELPLAVPYLAAGFRTAAVQVVATATLAAFVNGGGLGMIISRGFGLGLASGGGQVVAGALDRDRALRDPRRSARARRAPAHAAQPAADHAAPRPRRPTRSRPHADRRCFRTRQRDQLSDSNACRGVIPVEIVVPAGLSGVLRAGSSCPSDTRCRDGSDLACIGRPSRPHRDTKGGQTGCLRVHID